MIVSIDWHYPAVNRQVKKSCNPLHWVLVVQ
jgi:hypothetical protein